MSQFLCGTLIPRPAWCELNRCQISCQGIDAAGEIDELRRPPTPDIDDIARRSIGGQHAKHAIDCVLDKREVARFLAGSGHHQSFAAQRERKEIRHNISVAAGPFAGPYTLNRRTEAALRPC